MSEEEIKEQILKDIALAKEIVKEEFSYAPEDDKIGYSIMVAGLIQLERHNQDVLIED